MFNKFKGLVALFSVLCVSIITGASAYFYFGGEAEYPIDKAIENTTGGSNDNGITADNILENYEFSANKDLNEEYTYIFFPSTLYTEFYTDTQKPEDKFGYNEVILDDSGDPALNSDNQPQYNIVKKGNTTYYDYMVELNNNPNSYLAFGENSAADYPNTLNRTTRFTESNEERYYTFEEFKDPYIINNPNLLAYVNGVTDQSKYGQVWQYNRWRLGQLFNYYFYNYELNDGGSLEEPPGVREGSVGGGLNPNDDPRTAANAKQKLPFGKANEVLSPTFSTDDAFDINLSNDTNETYNNLFRAFLNNVSKSFLNDNNINFSLEAQTKGSDYNMYGRVQYRNDRFGGRTAFYDWDDKNNIQYYNSTLNQASRYLPIKITVNGNLTPDDMAKVIPSLTCSSYDKYWYFDYTSNVWTYAKSSDDRFYKTALGGITAKDVANIFDIMQHPSKYCDSNKVIRLFPVFSNGKGYDQSVSQGGADGIRADFKYKSTSTAIADSYLPDQTKLSYSTKTFENLYGSSNVVNYAVLKNVELVKERFDTITFRITTTGSPAGWGSNWTDAYKFSGYAIDNFINSFGEGLYTFYLFIGNRASNQSRGSNVAFDNINGIDFLSYITDEDSSADNDLKNKHLMPFYEAPNSGKITTTGNSGFKFIQGDGISGNVRPIALAVEKVTNLRLVSDIPIVEYDDRTILYNGELYTYTVDGNTIRAVDESESYQLTIVYDETAKSLDVTWEDDEGHTYHGVLTDFVPADIGGETPEEPAGYIGTWTGKVGPDEIELVINDVGMPSDNQDWSQIDSNVQAGLINAQNFIIADEVYEITETKYNTENLTGTDLTGPTLDSSNPYIYLIQNADFRFVNNLYFQIRFSNQYINNGLNVTTDYQIAYANKADTPEYLAYKIDDENLIKFKFQDSNDEDIFIDNTDLISGTLNNGQTVERQGFKLKDYNARGIYDILLVSTNDSASSQQKFNMYINRHTNSFIKLFRNDPGTFNLDNSTKKDIFVKHKLPTEAPEDEQYQVRNATSRLLWNGQTFLGEYLQTSTLGKGYTDEIQDKAESTLLDAIKKELGVEPGRDKIYPIYDAVTKKEVAYYNSGVGRLFTSDGSTADNSTSLNLFTIMKNYVLYIGNPVSLVA